MNTKLKKSHLIYLKSPELVLKTDWAVSMAQLLTCVVTHINANRSVNALGSLKCQSSFGSTCQSSQKCMKTLASPNGKDAVRCSGSYFNLHY